MVAIRGHGLYMMGAIFKTALCTCLDAATGKEIWRYSFPNFREPQATPTVEGSSVCCLRTDGIMLYLDAGNRKLRWKKDLVADNGTVKGRPTHGRHTVLTPEMEAARAAA